MKYNPFRPNSIVSPKLFHGREEEMKFIEQSLFQTKYGNPQHFLIEGERGLGKSSLFLMVEQQASGKLPLGNSDYVNFIVINIELDSTQSIFEILKCIANEFKRALSEKEKVKNMAIGVWEFLNKWEVLGVRYHKIDESLIQPYEILNELVVNFEKVIKQAKGELDGILILIDEADRPSVKASLGEIVKLLTEKLTKKGCDQVVIGMTGQPGLIEKLKESHESSSRPLHPGILSQSAQADIQGYPDPQGHWLGDRFREDEPGSLLPALHPADLLLGQQSRDHEPGTGPRQGRRSVGRLEQKIRGCRRPPRCLGTRSLQHGYRRR
jgi:hypothetical protein